MLWYIRSGARLGGCRRGRLPCRRHGEGLRKRRPELKPRTKDRMPKSQEPETLQPRTRMP